MARKKTTTATAAKLDTQAVPYPIGTRIVDVREMTEEEMEQEGWGYPATVLELSDGSKLYASRDEEGNGPGALFAMTAAGSALQIILTS